MEPRLENKRYERRHRPARYQGFRPQGVRHRHEHGGPAYSASSSAVPELDPDYLFDKDTTLAILAGFAHNRRVMVTGYHGTGKSTHIEQVAARLNWPCVRVNLDSHVSRIDLVGKDAIVLKDGKQVTEFKDGILRGPTRTTWRWCSTSTTPAART